jgi:hypothetical protein
MPIIGDIIPLFRWPIPGLLGRVPLSGTEEGRSR